MIELFQSLIKIYTKTKQILRISFRSLSNSIITCEYNIYSLCFQLLLSFSRKLRFRSSNLLQSTPEIIPIIFPNQLGEREGGKKERKREKIRRRETQKFHSTQKRREGRKVVNKREKSTDPLFNAVLPTESTGVNISRPINPSQDGQTSTAVELPQLFNKYFIPQNRI